MGTPIGKIVELLLKGGDPVEKKIEIKETLWRKKIEISFIFFIGHPSV